MNIYAFEPVGFEGELVTVEVDLHRGIPAVDIVGLPDGAVKEARERIRAAVRNSGFQFPLERLLISLAPAGIRKGGASFDLAMAMAILVASGQIPVAGSSILALGELELSGRVRPVTGVLSAIASALRAGIQDFVVPRDNLLEARALAGNAALAIDDLSDCVGILSALRGIAPKTAYGFNAVDAVERSQEENYSEKRSVPEIASGDMADIRGQAGLRRAMEIAAAGGHHLMLFGPPGVGKSMAARRMVGLLPDLDDDDAITVTTLHSLAGALPGSIGLMRKPPFRSPHHGASVEGIVGGGKLRRPGEISLAHGGVLLLDEAAEFRSDVLQALREPLEEGRITIARADRVVSYPSRFMLVLSCNPCPCGNLGREGGVCLCSPDEIRRYWKRLGGPLLDRIDMRIPVKATAASDLASGPGESSVSIRARVEAARSIQRKRYTGLSFRLNAGLEANGLDVFCRLEADACSAFVKISEREGLSSRASHSILRVARTIADLESLDTIKPCHLDEALHLRRFGDSDIFWLIP